LSGRVEGKVALVTGAGTGIGRAVCVRLAEEGADVVVTSQTAAHVEETCRLAAEASGRELLGLQLDVGDSGAVARVVGQVVERFGRIDILSNNAGIELVHGPSVVETTDDEWERVFRVNVDGTFYACRAAIPHMPDGASIVNMASINSFVAWENDAPYTATKGAVLQLTRALALELASRNVRVNAVCPGVIDTPLTDAFLERAGDPEALRAEYAATSPLNRMGTAREVANCVLFLASADASFVTGSALVVDGATTAR
jgi:NAD(P)-dependent dehydrogenase (short-subunit alcohol dehydrogenase family)